MEQAGTCWLERIWLICPVIAAIKFRTHSLSCKLESGIGSCWAFSSAYLCLGDGAAVLSCCCCQQSRRSRKGRCRYRLLMATQKAHERLTSAHCGRVSDVVAYSHTLLEINCLKRNSLSKHSSIAGPLYRRDETHEAASRAL